MSSVIGLWFVFRSLRTRFENSHEEYERMWEQWMAGELRHPADRLCSYDKVTNMDLISVLRDRYMRINKVRISRESLQTVTGKIADKYHFHRRSVQASFSYGLAGDFARRQFVGAFEIQDFQRRLDSFNRFAPPQGTHARAINRQCEFCGCYFFLPVAQRPFSPRFDPDRNKCPGCRKDQARSIVGWEHRAKFTAGQKFLRSRNLHLSREIQHYLGLIFYECNNRAREQFKHQTHQRRLERRAIRRMASAKKRGQQPTESAQRGNDSQQCFAVNLR